MADKSKYLDNLNNIFNEIHENLTTIRNYIACFYKICVDKITEYEPNKKFEEDAFNSIRDLFDKAIKDELEISQQMIIAKMDELVEKHHIDIKDFRAKQAEQIANGTKLGIELDGIAEKFDFYVKSQKLLLVNGLENMVTSFEDFLSNIFVCHYDQYDGMLDGKTITLKEIKSLSSVEDIKKAVISNEVERLLHQSIEQLFDDIMKKSFKLNLNYFNHNKTLFLEIFYRRNIFIHNKGIVNGTYINNSKNPYNLELDKYAAIDVEYLYNAASMFLLVAAEIVTEIVSRLKIDPGEYKEENSMIEKIAFHNYLCREDWNFAQEFYEILSMNKHLTALSLDMYRLNIMLCKKKKGELSVEEIKKEKWDNKMPILKIGYYALIEEYGEMETTIIQYKSDEDNAVGTNDLRKWPIFTDYRCNEKERFEKLVKRLTPKQRTRAKKAKRIDN